MQFRNIFITLFFLLSVSTHSYAGLIHVDFSAEFDQNAPTQEITGSFTYNDITFDILKVDLEISGIIHDLTTVGIVDLNGSWLFGSTLDGSINGFSSNVEGDFSLNTGSFVNGQYLHSMSFSDGTNGYEDILFSVVINESPVDVPEPSTIAIFALGLIGLTSRRLKK